jgi:hypothetical protein
MSTPDPQNDSPDQGGVMTQPIPDATTIPDKLRVVVRPLPKVVFFYLTWIISAIIGMWPGDPGPTMGLIWMGVFFFNTLVISFDFNEERSLILVLGGLAAILGLLYFGVLGSVSQWFAGLTPEMDRTFYWMIFSGFSVVFFFVWLNTRFDYWEFRPNEVVHRHGIFPKMKRYSTEDMRWDKTIPDMLERLLLGTGTIILTTPHERHPVVLNHVARIGSIDDRIADILGVKAVVHRDVSGPSES